MFVAPWVACVSGRRRRAGVVDADGVVDVDGAVDVDGVVDVDGAGTRGFPFGLRERSRSAPSRM